MKASKFTDAQKAFVIKQGEEGTPVAEVCRKAGISQATYFNWKKKYAGLLPTEMRRLRELEEENGRLKRIVADLTLDREMLQDIVRRNVWSAPSLQGYSGFAWRLTVRVNVSGLSRVGCCCSQAMMRSAHAVPNKLVRAERPLSATGLTSCRSTVSSSHSRASQSVGERFQLIAGSRLS